MRFKLTVKFEIEWIMIMKFNIAIFVFTEKNQVITLGHNRLLKTFYFMISFGFENQFHLENRSEIKNEMEILVCILN